jgi:hypothetical protein
MRRKGLVASCIERAPRAAAPGRAYGSMGPIDTFTTRNDLLRLTVPLRADT